MFTVPVEETLSSFLAAHVRVHDLELELSAAREHERQCRDLYTRCLLQDPED